MAHQLRGSGPAGRGRLALTMAAVLAAVAGAGVSFAGPPDRNHGTGVTPPSGTPAKSPGAAPAAPPIKPLAPSASPPGGSRLPPSPERPATNAPKPEAGDDGVVLPVGVSPAAAELVRRVQAAAEAAREEAEAREYAADCGAPSATASQYGRVVPPVLETYGNSSVDELLGRRTGIDVALSGLATAYRQWQDPCKSRRTIGEGSAEDPFVTGRVEAPKADRLEVVRKPVEWADAAMREARFQDALDGYGEYLVKFPDDTRIARQRAMALLLDGKTSAGIEAMATVYSADPALASAGFDAGQLPTRGDSVRRALNAVVGIANRGKSGNAWLTAIVLMQAEGRGQQAAKLVERAEAGGVSAGVVRELRLALKP